MSKPFWEIRRVARCFAELFWINNWETIYAVIKMGCMKCIKIIKFMKLAFFIKMSVGFSMHLKKIDSDF